MPITIRSPRDAIAHGIYLIPEDRKRAGLILEDDITQQYLAAEPGGIFPSPGS